MSEATKTSQLLAQVQEQSRRINPAKLIKREFVRVDGEVCNQNSEVACNGVMERRDADCLRVMQWNLLAQGLCQSSDGFLLCPLPALDWQFRQNRILEELLSYSVDIYCLEEVDHFSFLSDHLGQLGFKGCFCPKPDSPCLYQANNSGPDGCAVFWRESQFQLLQQDNVILCDDSQANTNQVALMCKFRGLQGHMKDRDFICVTTHLKSKIGYDQLRFMQAKFLEKLLREKVAGLPIVLCGDFNADPQSTAVDVIKKSTLALKSAYSLLSSNGDEPPYTTWKVRAGRRFRGPTEVCHTIDYLFFSMEHFKATQLLRIPTYEEIGPNFLPSFSYPSDHISLVADLKLDESHQA